MKIYRQGDVLLVECDTIPRITHPVERQKGRIVLAEGETTGHAHVITEDWVQELCDEVNRRYIDVRAKAATLAHEEHGTITVPPGMYRIMRQREYTPEAIRNVRD